MKVALALMAAFALAGCRGPEGRKIQYVPDMADSPTVKPQKNFLDPPEGSVAMNAILYPKTPEEAEKLLTMPPRIGSDPGTAELGKKHFETFCVVCHGADAKGIHALGDAFPRPPDLTLPMYASKGDGFFFYRITFGSAVMPSYGHAISPHERWQIIAHLRTLQKAGH